MGFYTNIRSDVSLVKQTVDMIFASKSHTCHCEDFICILNSNSEGSGYWYHVYRVDDFIMRFVRCERAFRSNGSILGPSYHTETDDVFEVNMIEMLEDRNRAAYQDYVNSITFKMDSETSEDVKFYKADADTDYTYPFTTDESVVEFNYSV